jgi:hypothetical protein
MRKKISLFLLIVMLVVVVGTHRALAQATSSPQADNTAASQTKPKSAENPPDEYHLEFSLNEFEDGKKINSRQYSMHVSSNQPDEIKIGSRVPVETKAGEFEYLDVGASITARISESRGQSQLHVRADLSTVVGADQNQPMHDVREVIRQLRMGGTVNLPLAKTVVIDSADDPDSKRQFQLELTATKR